MNIGNVIKKYRRQKDLTQEQLAEYLNVSVSAVSQWESGKTTPDIAMVVSLANFFDITTDELLGRKDDRDTYLDEAFEKEKIYLSQGKIMANLALWREAVQKYPGDFVFMEKLARALDSTLYIGIDDKAKNDNAKEALLICARILRDCRDDIVRGRTIEDIVCLYSNKNLEIVNEKLAVDYAESAPCIWHSREILVESAYFSDENREKKLLQKHRNILNLLDYVTQRIYYEKYDDPAEKIDACKTALKLWETVIYDGNYIFFHCRLQKIYELMARSYAELNNADESISALEKALYHAKEFDSIPSGELPYTSKYVKYAIEDISFNNKNYIETNVEIVRKFMKSKRFDFICEDPRFIALTK